MLTFPEEILLLLHRAEDGSFLPIGTHALKRVLVCSVLMELEFAYRIDTVPAQLTVGDRTPTGNPLLDRALERIAASEEIQGHQGMDRDTVRDRRRHDQGRHAGQPDGAGHSGTPGAARPGVVPVRVLPHAGWDGCTRYQTAHHGCVVL